jgi:hypothetical protein
MSGKPTQRVVVVIVLLILVAAALRGYFPAHDPASRPEPGAGQAGLMFVIAALAATLTLMAIAVIARLRDPRQVAPTAGDLSDMLGRDTQRPSWRVMLIVLAVIVAWILLATLLSQWVLPHDIDTAIQDSATPPRAPDASASPPKRQPQNNNGDMLGILLVSAVPLMLIIFVGSIVAARRRWRPPAPGVVDDYAETPAPPTRSEPLVRAAEVGLAEIADLRREPREAIIACYAAMERELANVPGAVPQDFDTPTEVLARAVERHALHADNAVQLVNLFAEARFSPHVMNEGHREVAVRVLQLVLDELSHRSVA